jgi:hypothetical protein
MEIQEEQQPTKKQKVSHDDSEAGKDAAESLPIPSADVASANESKAEEPKEAVTSKLSLKEQLIEDLETMQDYFETYGEEYTNEKTMIVESDYCYKGNHMVYSTSLPSKPDYNIRWTERVASYYIPSASFTYEVQYPNPKTLPLGFTYQWQYIPYSPSNPGKTILCCVVKAVHEPFQNSIIVGDIILKMNEELLVYKPGDAVDFQKLDLIFSETFKSLTGFCSIRFLRAGSTCSGSVPSVAEILLLVNEKSAGAKFNVKTIMKDNSETYGLELVQMDNQLPNAVKKLLQSQKVSWQQIPILSIGSAQANYLISANITPQMSSLASSVIGSMTLNYTTPIYNIHSTSLEEIMKPNSDNFIRSGIYREKSKFVVIYVDRSATSTFTHSLKYPGADAPPESGNITPRIYNLGRFDTEEEAKRVFHKVKFNFSRFSIFNFFFSPKQVVNSVKATGSFNLKYYLLGLHTKK